MAVPLTITVHVADTVRPACDGRRQLSLGIPSTASVGDVLESLFKLYPRLLNHLANERRGTQQGLRLVMGHQPQPAPGAPEPGLRQGQRLYLVAVAPKRAAS